MHAISPNINFKAFADLVENVSCTAGRASSSLAGVQVSDVGRWLTATASLASAGSGFDRPGLWKRVSQDSIRFDLPASAVGQEADEGCAVEGFAEWAAASARGELPEGWEPPSQGLVDSWLPPHGLSLQLGPFAVQGQLILEPGRWELRFPVVPRVPLDLPPGRQRALKELIEVTEATWRMVRLGFSSEAGERQLVVAVNLSGAPHSEALFLAGLAGVRHVVAWVVEVADLLVDVSVPLRAPEIRWPENT